LRGEQPDPFPDTSRRDTLTDLVYDAASISVRNDARPVREIAPVFALLDIKGIDGGPRNPDPYLTCPGLGTGHFS
jgi:hypothetical protein